MTGVLNGEAFGLGSRGSQYANEVRDGTEEQRTMGEIAQVSYCPPGAW